MSGSVSVISQTDKEHLKSLFGEFLSCKKYHDLMQPGWISKNEMMLTLCAVYGKFDFSVVLEHFSDLLSALEYLGNEKSFMKWNDFMIHYAAYTLLDCPFLNLAVGSSNDFKLMQEQLERLLFVSCSYGKEKSSWKIAILSKNIQSALDKDDFPLLLKAIGSEQTNRPQIANIAYAALEKEKWNIFAGLHAQYDLLSYIDMEKVFDFWCKELLPKHNDYLLNGKRVYDFTAQWQVPEKYPLHRMMIEYGRERCVPALYNQGLLLPDVIEYLWNNGISFDTPLTVFYGWEKVTFSAFAAYFGDLSEKIDLIPMPKYPPSGEKVFRQNVKSAAFFNEYSAKHPRKTPDVKSAPAVKKAKGELTDEQKIRLANDEAAGVIFSKNKKTLVRYASCIRELDEWIKSGYKVPDFVTAIGAEAFSKVESIELKTVILPEGLTKIGPRAFRGRIETAVFPATLKTIGVQAFLFSKLKELHLSGVESIGDYAFAFCSKLQSVFLPDTLIKIGCGLFRRCENLTEVRLSAALETIPPLMFDKCGKLEKFIIPDSVKKIEREAFADCPSLRLVEVPKGIEICKTAFRNHSPELKIIYREPASATRS